MIGSTGRESMVFKLPDPARFVFFPRGLIRIKVGLSRRRRVEGEDLGSAERAGFMTSWARIESLDISYRGRRKDE